nr:cobalamin biosynthesis protein CbiA [candidate division Zixibacteria bacterium]
MANEVKIRYPSILRPITIIVGGFGSGKTEVSVNIAKFLAATQDSPVTIVDLDLVNPYFRSRETVREMEALGVRAVAPKGGQFYADLPILLPEVKGIIERHEGKVILDVGGDAQGTRALGSLADEFETGTFEMLMVLNSRRPQTSDVDGSIKMMQRIELTARLKFTGLISNSHMIDETNAEIIDEGYRLAREVGSRTGLPLFFVSVKRDILEGMDTGGYECAFLPLTRSMLKPWERKKETG